jgi:hypothetical protein
MYIHNQRRYTRVTSAAQLSRPVIMFPGSPETTLDELSIKVDREEISQAEADEMFAQMLLFLEEQAREAVDSIKLLARETDHNSPVAQEKMVVQAAEGIVTAVVSCPEAVSEVVDEQILAPSRRFAQGLFAGIAEPPVNGRLNVHGRPKMPEAEPLLKRVQRMMRSAMYGGLK